VKLRMPSRRLLVVALGAAGLVAGASARPAMAAATHRAPATPQSCKPRPPLQMTLEPGAASGIWRLRTEATAAVPHVVLVLRDDAGGAQVVWRGALVAGAVREFDVRFALQARATRLTAEATLQDAPDAIVRSVASVAVAGGKIVAAGAATTVPANGQMIPASGGSDAVLELPGVTGSRQ
jgi:hypothetical protein